MNRDELPYDAFGDYSEIDKSDLISRAEAIRVIADQYMFEASIDNRYASEDIKDYIEIAQDLLKDIPSVEPSKEDLHREKEQAYMQGYEDGLRKNREILAEITFGGIEAINEKGAQK